MQKKAKHSAKLKRLFLGAITGLVLTTSISADKKATEPSAVQNDNLIKAFKESRAKTYSEYIEISDYFTSDTLYINKHNARKRICLGQYMPKKTKLKLSISSLITPAPTTPIHLGLGVLTTLIWNNM